MAKDDTYLKDQMMLIERRMKEVDSAKTSSHYRKILDRIFSLFDKMRNKSVLETFLVSLGDAEVWCALWVQTPEGRPLLMTPTQSKMFKGITENEKVWSFCHRRFGKSIILAARIVKWMFERHEYPWKHICVAPSQEQMHLYLNYIKPMMKRLFDELRFIREAYFTKDNSDIFNKRIRLDNGNGVLNKFSSKRHKGGNILGENASSVSMDEIEQYDDVVELEVVKPLLSSKFSKSRLIKIGTPDDSVNPNLKRRWEFWKDSDKKHFHIDWKTGVEEGIVKEEEVVSDMREYGRDSDYFRKMWLAQFPTGNENFYKKSYFRDSYNCSHHRLLTSRSSFDIDEDDIDFDGEYVMGVDFGGYKDKFEVVVGDVNSDGGEKSIEYVFWYEAGPEDEVDIEDQGEIAKRVFWLFNEPMVFADGNRQGDIRWLVKPGKYKPISRHKIYCNDSARKKDKLGIVFPNEVVKEEFHKNHQYQLLNNRLISPLDKDFYERWRLEHLSLDVRPSKSTKVKNLYRKGDVGDDLLMSTVYMSWYLREKDRSPNVHVFRTFEF